MGTTTNGEIWYGVLFEEGLEFPWDIVDEDSSDEGDIEEWWRSVNGYVPLHTPFTEAGEYADGWHKDDPRFREYYDHRHKWLADNPLPVEMVNVCSGDYPMYGLAVVGSVRTANRGFPETFDPAELKADATVLLDFCKRFSIEHGEPSWYLSSYWG